MAFEKGHPYYPKTASGAVWALDGEPEPLAVRPAVIVTRFMLADVPSRAEWLLGRLAEKWPHISEATFSGRLRAWIGSNSHYLTKTPHAIGLVRVVRAELDPLPIAEQVFLFLADPKDRHYDREGVAISRDACRWAKSLGASKYFVDRTCDLKPSSIRDALGATDDIVTFAVL